MSFFRNTMYRELEASYKFSLNILHSSFILERPWWIWSIRIWPFFYCLKNHNLVLTHMSHLFSNATFSPECLILYRVVHGRQYSLPIIGPPISSKLPMLSLFKVSSYAQCLLVIYSHSNFHRDSQTIQSSLKNNETKYVDLNTYH